MEELNKLSCIKSEEVMDQMMCTLWKTRKTGLRPPDKSHFQSLLHLSSLSELDPVLVCLRSLIRKCVYQNLTGDELLKLFPTDLPLDVQSILVLSLQKNHPQWKQDASREQDFLPRTSVAYQIRTKVPPSFTSVPSSEISTPPWPRQDDSLAQMNRSDFGISAPLVADVNLSGLPACFQPDIAPAENLVLENLPCLKSMTWTMENRGSSPTDRVAIISLKLHDYSKSPSGETEVKFQLTRDTLEAMLKSMTYIREQLSVVGTSSEPENKKQKK
ncbi:putative COMM domain-containing protein [Lupinus albus]|uniref:Putative COMM domain-containing protein n=1 Tax=Lupinus albus TaxID=3870 RepID=A0A6A4NIR5_LUPAL|nr:putative COMM domain-containing protein [Lupinus albus]